MKTIQEILVSKSNAVGIVFLDINGLKKINDQYGHDAGDELISNVVNVLKGSFSDNIFRIGGDEFVVLFIGKSKEEFEKKVAHLKFTILEEKNISVSIGASWCTDTDDIFKQIAFTDELMYVDKQKHYSNIEFNRRSDHNISHQ